MAERIHDELETRLVAQLVALQKAAEAVEGAELKKSHAQLASQAQLLYSDFCLFEAGISAFPGHFHIIISPDSLESTANDLSAYLLRSIGTDLANLLLSFASGTANPKGLTPKQREETINSLPDDSTRGCFATLFQSLQV